MLEYISSRCRVKVLFSSPCSFVLVFWNSEIRSLTTAAMSFSGGFDLTSWLYSSWALLRVSTCPSFAINDSRKPVSVSILELRAAGPGVLSVHGEGIPAKVRSFLGFDEEALKEKNEDRDGFRSQDEYFTTLDNFVKREGRPGVTCGY